MNLSTARSSERAREVGVRKALGSLREQLIVQFLVEAIILSVCATLLAVGLARLALPAFNNLANQNFGLPLTDPAFIVTMITIATVVGFLAGSYPAFALSSFNTVAVMKSNFAGSNKGIGLRNGLVVFQFFISIVLIIGTIVVAKQMQYMQQKSLGYNKEQVMVMSAVPYWKVKGRTFLDEVRSLSLRTKRGRVIRTAGTSR